MGKKTYLVQRRLKHEGKILAPGAPVELHEEHAAQHLKSGALSLPKAETKPASEVGKGRQGDQTPASDEKLQQLKDKRAAQLAAQVAKMSDKQLAAELADTKKKKPQDVVGAIQAEIAKRAKQPE